MKLFLVIKVRTDGTPTQLIHSTYDRVEANKICLANAIEYSHQQRVYVVSEFSLTSRAFRDILV